MPGPSEVIASSALIRRLAREPALAALVPGTVVGEVGASGLVGPDELFAYIGVHGDQIADPHEAAAFGSRDVLALERQQAGLTQSLALLVLPPVVVYLIVCGRLAAATRIRRYAALRLLGMRRGVTTRVAFAESAVAGIAGGALGLALFAVAHPVLASSGGLGFSWFAPAAGLGAVAVVAVLLVVCVAAGLVGAAASGAASPARCRPAGTRPPRPRARGCCCPSRSVSAARSFSCSLPRDR
jgi:hypothetical protein